MSLLGRVCQSVSEPPLVSQELFHFVLRPLERIIVYNIVMWQSQINWSAGNTGRGSMEELGLVAKSGICINQYHNIAISCKTNQTIKYINDTKISLSFNQNINILSHPILLTTTFKNVG